MLKFIGRVVGAMVPLLLACIGAVAYAQLQDTDRLERQTERRFSALEIADARQEERYHAIVGRIDAIDKTLWWLVVATIGGTGVSGVVATDRAVHRLKAQRRQEDQ